MKAPPKKIIIPVVVVAALGFAAWLLARSGNEADTLSGYVEGETLYLAAPVAGAVRQVSVRRGDRVAAGAPLFVVEPEQLRAQAARSAADVAAAEALAVDARKGQRPVELAVYAAEEAAANAAAREAEVQLARVRTLVGRGVYAPARLDEAEASAGTARAQATAARSRREAAGLGARSDQVQAADARVAQARAGLAETSARLSDLSPTAPAAGRIENVFYQPGEWAAANQPVVALIPDARVFVRFFVPEQDVSAYAPGARVAFACDGCPRSAATVSFVSPRPEYTPPVIYSRQTRDRLVFMVEARPDAPTRLVPGLPVDVTPLAGK